MSNLDTVSGDAATPSRVTAFPARVTCALAAGIAHTDAIGTA